VKGDGEMKLDDVTEDFLDVPVAGALVGLGRNAAYQAAKKGELPTIRFGKILRVPVKALRRLAEGK
jgi:predicted DNA-binding transcriptional regulator AlpA